MTKYQATLTSDDAADCSLDVDGDIFLPTEAEEGGEPVYAKDGTGAPYLIYGTITLDSGEGTCLLAARDENGPYYDGCYTEVTGTWVRVGEGSQPIISPVADGYWEFSGVGTSAGQSFDGPYIGQYGTPGYGMVTSWAPAEEYNGWFISNSATISALQDAVDGVGCGNQLPFVFGIALPGTFSQPSQCGDVDCTFYLSVYHYSNPDCVRVKAASSGGTPTYDYEGDYAFTGNFFPTDDDQDYGTFSDGAHYIWRDVTESRWYMGDAVDGTPYYQTPVTDKRTPPRGPWFGVAEATDGRYKTLPTCTGRLWQHWCECSCECDAPEPYVGCLSVACGEGECPSEFLGTYYPQSEVGGTWAFSNGSGGYLGFNVAAPPRCRWEIGDAFGADPVFHKRPAKGEEWPGDPTGTYYGTGDYDGMTLEVTSASCGVFNYCGIQNVPIAWALTVSGFGTFTVCPCSSTDVYSFNGNRTWLISHGGTCWGVGDVLQVCWSGIDELSDRVFAVGITFEFVAFEYDPGPPPVYHYTPTLVVTLRWSNGLGTSFCGQWWQWEGPALTSDYEALDPIELTLTTNGGTSCVGFAPSGCETPLEFTPPGSLTISPVL